jgi:hypothetical protein
MMFYSDVSYLRFFSHCGILRQTKTFHCNWFIFLSFDFTDKYFIDWFNRKRITLLGISPAILELAAVNIQNSGVTEKIDLIDGRPFQNGGKIFIVRINHA